MSERGAGPERFADEDNALVTVAQFYDPMRAQMASRLVEEYGSPRAAP